MSGISIVGCTTLCKDTIISGYLLDYLNPIIFPCFECFSQFWTILTQHQSVSKLKIVFVTLVPPWYYISYSLKQPLSHLRNTHRYELSGQMHYSQFPDKQAYSLKANP